MWMFVEDAATGIKITNATFPWFNFYNRQDGWYFVYNIGANASYACSAPGYYNAWGNTDGYSYMVNFLTRIPPQPPPPPPSGGGWA
jgi:hypothetical protein